MSSSPTPQASSSPTPTATANIADLLASFTSTSSDSTAVRIARERRKQEREARWESRKTELEGVEGEGPASEDGLRRGGGFQSPPRPWPKLHVQESESIGGRSYSPSLPGSPLPGTPGGAVLSPPPTADLPAPKPSPSPTTPSPTRKPAAIAEIPPFRPKPTPSPTSKPISSPGTGGAGEDKVKVTMSMGLMERLKAKKAAAGAGAGGDASARTGGAPSQQVAAAVPLPDTPTQASRTSPPRQSQPPLVPSPVATPPRQSLLPTSPPHISPSHPSPPVSTTPLDDSPPRTSLPRTEPTQHPSLPNYPLSSPSYQFTASSTAPATSPAKPSAKERVEEQLARLERSDDDEEVPGVTRWDIQGNEFSFEPTPLSPLTCALFPPETLLSLTSPQGTQRASDNLHTPRQPPFAAVPSACLEWILGRSDLRSPLVSRRPTARRRHLPTRRPRKAPPSLLHLRRRLALLSPNFFLQLSRPGEVAKPFADEADVA